MAVPIHMYDGLCCIASTYVCGRAHVCVCVGESGRKCESKSESESERASACDRERKPESGRASERGRVSTSGRKRKRSGEKVNEKV